MSNRVTQAMIAPFGVALAEWRVENHYNQDELAAELGVSRKTYILLESGRWYPPYMARAYWLKELHKLDPALMAPFVSVVGHTLDEYLITLQPDAPAAPPPAPAPAPRELAPKLAKSVYDAALFATAEEADMAPKALRPIAAALIGRLADGGLTIDQAAALAKAKGT